MNTCTNVNWFLGPTERSDAPRGAPERDGVPSDQVNVNLSALVIALVPNLVVTRMLTVPVA
jgi:hypothetical protein